MAERQDHAGADADRGGSDGPGGPGNEEKMLAGELYDPRDPQLVAARDQAQALCRTLNGTPATEPDTRRRIFQELFAAVGDDACVQSPFHCDYGGNIVLGARVYFNVNCTILDVCEVRIGDCSLFGPGVQILTALHPMNAQLRRSREYGRPVTIGSDVWVGAGALILPGVCVGSRSVIGAGSVVTRDVPEDVLAAGNPCRVLRDIGP